MNNERRYRKPRSSDELILVPPEPIKSFFETVNIHDAQGFLPAFTDNGTVDDWGRLFTGREAIERWSDREFIGSRGVLEITEVITGDAEITVIGDWRSTHANGMSRFTFTTIGDKISTMTIRAA